MQFSRLLVFGSFGAAHVGYNSSAHRTLQPYFFRAIIRAMKHGNGFKNITGHKFGRLRVISYQDTMDGKARWTCVCDCGSETTVTGDKLRRGTTRSCGCFRDEFSGSHTRTHGMKNTPIYGIWRAMLTRCYNKDSEGFALYGARGITVCDRWRNSFENFFADMGHRPEGKTLDRRNNLEGYSPENCRWSTIAEQSRNRRSNIFATIGGETLCVFDWCARFGTNWKTAYRRISRGWEPSRAVTEPAR